ncbi:MAG: TetR/AcrR family transcriptional regulator [Oscillospiraceae bacterium]|nr:TetR/AcrR family transcriptional regulator [Oscillospiraceae bacterium]
MRTKEKILEKALILFAERGYENVSVEEIAAEVGIKAPSIYKHYKSKQDIFDAIIDKMKNNDVYKNITDTISSNNKFNDAGVFTGDLTQMITTIGFESFVELSSPTELTQFRKLMTVEQFNTPELAELFVKQYYDNMISRYSDLFSKLSSSGVFKNEDPELMALQFYAPLFMLMTMSDAVPERKDEFSCLVENYIDLFIKIYSKENH